MVGIYAAQVLIVAKLGMFAEQGHKGFVGRVFLLSGSHHEVIPDGAISNVAPLFGVVDMLIVILRKVRANLVIKAQKPFLLGKAYGKGSVALAG